MLHELNINLDITAINESRIRENVSHPINIPLQNYPIEHTPTEASAVGALWYISSRLLYKPRRYLKLYAPGKVESVFIEIICPNSPNLIIGCIYKYSILNISDFDSNYISPFLHKLSNDPLNKYF